MSLRNSSCSESKVNVSMTAKIGTIAIDSDLWIGMIKNGTTLRTNSS